MIESSCIFLPVLLCVGVPVEGATARKARHYVVRRLQILPRHLPLPDFDLEGAPLFVFAVKGHMEDIFPHLGDAV